MFFIYFFCYSVLCLKKNNSFTFLFGLSRYLVWKWTGTILEVLYLGEVFVSILKAHGKLIMFYLMVILDSFIHWLYIDYDLFTCLLFFFIMIINFLLIFSFFLVKV
jgi:hypothetical protein